MSLLNGITPGVDEIMSGKDSFGNSGGLLTGITKGINEATNKYLNMIPGMDNLPLGAPGSEYAPLPKGISEYQYARDQSEAAGDAFLPPGLDENNPINYKQSFAPVFDVWNGIIKENTARINTVLEERAYVDFYFPNSEIGRRRVCFFENPMITETRQPVYASKRVVARNEPVRMYVGSEARKVKVAFTYTLPHVEHFFNLIGDIGATCRGFSNSIAQNGEDAAKLRGIGGAPQRTEWKDWRDFTAQKVSEFFGSFKTITNGPPEPIDWASDSLFAMNPNRNQRGQGGLGGRSPTSTKGTVGMTNTSQTKGPRFYEPNRSWNKPVEGWLTHNMGSMGEIGFQERLVKSWSLKQEDLDAAGMVATFYTQFVIDTIRASVVGDTVQIGAVGPPIARFRFGTIFNEAPFIVKNFSINYVNTAGYEVRTLLPRQIKFTLDLEEFRQTHGSHHGDFQEQVPGASNILELDLNPHRSQVLPERAKLPS